MTNKLLFSNSYLLQTTFDGEIEKFSESLMPSIYPLKDDPYFGIDAEIERKIKSKYLSFQEKENIYFYYARGFLEGHYSGKPVFPYFKGNIKRANGNQINIEGKLKYNKVFNFMFPFGLIILCLAILLFNLSSFLFLVPITFILIIKVSARNLEKELIGDLRIKFEKVKRI